MKGYRVGVYYSEGTLLRIKANSPEEAEIKAQKILDDNVQAVFPDKCKSKLVHREVAVTDVEEMSGDCLEEVA